MSSLLKVTAVLAATAFGAIAVPVGCSSNASTSPTGGGSGGSGTGSSDSGIHLSDSSSDSRVFTFDAGDDGACAATSQTGHLTHVNLVILVDKSGSMGNPDEGGDPAKKWNPMVTAFTTFFQNVKSPAMYASFTFFPAPCDFDPNPASSGGCVCSPTEYQPDQAQANKSQTVELTPIAGHADTFISLLNNTHPTGGTPTIAALQGTYTYASTIKASAQDPEDVTSVILITDGLPAMGWYLPDGGTAAGPGCNGNDIATIKTLVGNYQAQGIDTYVFGVGTLPALSDIATAGGHPLVTIDVGDPQATTQQFLKSLNSIPVPKFKCASTIPTTAPDQTPVDLGKVNVLYTTSTATTPQPLYYRSDCSTGDQNGWRYSGNNIELCPNTCTALSADASVQLVMQFGCATQPAPVN
jgi:hypothetical protein